MGCRETEQKESDGRVRDRGGGWGWSWSPRPSQGKHGDEYNKSDLWTGFGPGEKLNMQIFPKFYYTNRLDRGDLFKGRKGGGGTR